MQRCSIDQSKLLQAPSILELRQLLIIDQIVVPTIDMIRMIDDIFFIILFPIEICIISQDFRYLFFLDFIFCF